MTSYFVNNVIIDTHRYFYSSWHSFLKLFPNFKFWMRIEVAISSHIFFYFMIYWWERPDCTVFFFFSFFFLFYTYCTNTEEQYVILHCTLLCCICIALSDENNVNDKIRWIGYSVPKYIWRSYFTHLPWHYYYTDNNFFFSIIMIDRLWIDLFYFDIFWVIQNFFMSIYIMKSVVAQIKES